MFVMISVSVSSRPNACNEDISVCVSPAFLVVLILVMRISMSVFNVFLLVLMLVMRISVCMYLVF